LASEAIVFAGGQSKNKKATRSWMNGWLYNK